MKNELFILKILKTQGLSNIDKIFNYLENLDYDLKKIR